MMRFCKQPTRSLLWIAAILLGLGSPARLASASVITPEPPVQIEAIEVEGNRRTSEATIWRYLGLRPGDEAPIDSIVAAFERLDESGLFESVEFASRPGTGRGRIVLHLDVVEQSLDFRFGAGYQDLSGWYLIPAEFRFDNRLGRGERTRLHLKFGHRLSGIHLLYEEPRAFDGRTRWGFSLFGEGGNRLYFVDRLEHRHFVSRGGIEAHIGREFVPGFRIDIGGGYETITADSTASAGQTDEQRDIKFGDEIPFEQLPPEVAGTLGERPRGVTRLDLTWNLRDRRRIVGTPVAGLWGRVRGVGYFPEKDPAYPVVTADFRAYRSAGPVAFAARVRGGWTVADTPWYDRFYVGGLYTVRGFPNQSISEPAGETRFWAASVEMRTPLVGDRANPRLTGIFFVDAADGWSDDNEPTADDVAVGAGYGLRLRVPWVGWLGVDVGIPLSDSPVEEAFHGNASIGMTF